MLPLAHFSSLGDAFSDALAKFKSRTFTIEADRNRETSTFSFQTFETEMLGFAAWLAEHGFVPGDRAAILMQNSPFWLQAAAAILHLGGVVVPLDYKLTAPEQASLCRYATPKVLVTEYPVWRKLAAESLPDSIEQVVVAYVPEGAPLARGIAWERARAAGRPALAARTRDDIACVVYSSGTGGTPKGCMLTHGNYLAQAESLASMYPMEEGDRYFSILPTNHAIDFMCGFVIPLLMGGTVVHQRTLRAEYLTWTMKRYGITHMALVPRLLKLFQEKMQEEIDALPAWKRNVLDGLVAVNRTMTWKAPNHALSSRLLKPFHDAFGGRMKTFFAGGAFVEKETAEFFQRLGFPVAIGYGTTEAGTVLTLNDLKPFRGDTVGRPIPGVELELRDVNAEGVGEVWVRGPTVMKGYLDAPELTSEAIVDGWLRTGDLGTIDVTGHLKLLGRARNMIVTEGGKNVYPEDLEAALGDVPGVEELCVFAANFVWPQQGLTGERLVVAVRPKEGVDEASIHGALERANRKLTDYRRLAGWVLWQDEFPRTASFKVKRNVLARSIGDRATREEAVRPLDRGEGA